MIAPLVLATALSAWPAPLQSAVKAEPVAPPPMAFTLNVQTARENLSLAHDPSASQRWAVKAPARELTKSEATLLKNMQDYKPARDFTCVGRTEIVPSSVTLKRETADEFIYGYKPKAGPNTPKQLASALKYAEGELSVSKATGRLSGGRIYTVQSFSPAPFASVKAYNDTYDCAPGPGGVSIVTRSSIRAQFAALGKIHDIKRDIQLSNVRRAD